MRRLLAGDISAAWEEIVVRLTDFGEAPDPTLTPREIADGIDESMEPLAQVYSRATYRPDTILPQWWRRLRDRRRET